MTSQNAKALMSWIDSSGKPETPSAPATKPAKSPPPTQSLSLARPARPSRRIESTANDWMTTNEAAEHARRHRNTILTALRSGELVGYQRTAPKGAWRIRASDLDKWLKGL